jgi:putative PIN family toxin of toxin-antitoxin system
MRLVVDTNIVISSLLNPNGVVGSVLLKEAKEIEKLTCQFLYVELFDKKDKMLSISKLEEEDFLSLLYFVIKEITFISEKQIETKNWEEASELVKGIDEKDVAFVALTLQTNALLWTGDKKLCNGLRAKGFQSVITTQELMEHLKK